MYIAPGNTFDKRILRDNLEGSFKLQSGENVLGQESFFKIERNDKKGNKESTDWKIWYQACLAGEIKTESIPQDMPELFSNKSTNSLERLTEAILGVVNSQ